MHIIRGWAIALFAWVCWFAFDQSCKAYFFTTQHPFSFFAGWIQSIQHYNYGIAFNIPIPQLIILIITLIACVGVFWAIQRAAQAGQILRCLFLGILLGGALGNAFDRAAFGYVRDWLLLWHHSAINIADIGVIIGLLGAISSRHQNTPQLH